MGTFVRLLSLLLCFELIVGPIQPTLSLMGQNAFAQESCPTGFSYDSTLNRCLTKDETQKVMNATKNCNGDKECYLNNAKQAYLDNGGEGGRKGDNQFVSKIANIAAIAGPVTYFAIGMSTTSAKCTSSSFWAMVAAAGALVVGDVLANMQHKKRLKKIKEDWGKIVNPVEASGDKDKERETSIEAQSEAFEMLARAEDSLASAAKMKRNFFLIATAAYAASAIISGYEMYTETTLSATALADRKLAQSLSPALVTAAATVNTAATAADAATAKATASDQTITAAASTPAPNVAAAKQALATLASIETASKALASQVPIATAAAAAVATESMGTAAVAAEKAAAAVAKSAASTNAWALHKQTVMCIPLNVGPVGYSNQESEGLYAQYTNGKNINVKEELQFIYNLQNSQDLASFVMNKKEMDGETYSPLDEFHIVKSSMGQIEIEENAFEYFKATTIAFMNELNPIPSAIAQETPGVDTNAANAYKEVEAKGPDLLSIGLGVGIGALILAKTKAGEWLITSQGRLAFSGVMGLLTLQMANHAGSQAEASTKRAELLRKMKDEFKTASGAIYACKSEDREDPAKPSCYCYTPENGRNPNRTGSTICQQLWAGVNLKPTDYSSGTTSSKVCVTNTGAADASCKCKSNNSCMKVGISGIKGINAGSMSVLSNPLSTLNGVTNGNIDAASLDSAALANQAAKLQQAAKKVENLPGVKETKKNRDKLAKALQTSGLKNSASFGSNSLGTSPSSGMPSNPGEAARMLEKEIEDSKINTPSGIGNDFIATPAAEPTPQLEFGMTQDELANQEGQIAEVMNQDLDYGGNDTNPDAKANIFEMLSHRYQRSGMKRLFEETPAAGTTSPAQTATAPTKQ